MKNTRELNEGIKHAISIFGSQKAVSIKVGCAQSTISDWLNCRKKVSPEYVPIIVSLTAGAVSACQLRPDLPALFPHPEQAPNHA